MSKQQATIALKTIHNDIIKANPNSTLTTKKMRVKLRTALKGKHTMNESWTFTSAQYDQVRAMFDAAYAKKVSKPAKATRKTRTTSTPAPVVAADA